MRILFFPIHENLSGPNFYDSEVIFIFSLLTYGFLVMLTTAISEQYLLIRMDNLFNIHGKLKESEHGLILGLGLQMLDMFPRLSYRRMQRLYPFCWFKIIQALKLDQIIACRYSF